MGHLSCAENQTEHELSLTLSPKHVAIIMDGNRRWAKKHHEPVEMGHWQGAETLDRIVQAAIDLGIKVLTVYSFSTENWKRSPDEVDALMHLLEAYLISKKKTLIQNGVRLETIGDLSRLPKSVKKVLDETKEATKDGDRIDLILALNYGGRDEICRATLRLIEDVQKGVISQRDVTEEMFGQYLDTARWPDPDLLIRPSGDLRISNFLNWQIAYSEIYYSDVLWPEFTKQHLVDAIETFQKRKRRFGA